MNIPDLETCTYIAALVCGQDGLISMSEENRMYQVLCTRFPGFDRSDFNKMLDDFFASKLVLEDYASTVEEKELQAFIIDLCNQSASSDDMEIRENLAFKKLLDLWAIKP